MIEYWRQYGHSIRLILLSAVVAYDCLGGMLVLVRWSDYDHPHGQMLLWAGCAAATALVVLRTRGPNFLPVFPVVAVLVSYVLSNLDLKSPDSVLGTWAAPMIGLTLVVLHHLVPVWCTLLGMTASTGVIWAMATITDAPSAFQGPISLGPVLGTVPGLGAMLVMRRRARRTAEIHRRLDVVRDAERAVRQDRAGMLKPALGMAVAVLRDLATGAADPADPAVRRACALAERQVRAALLAATSTSGLAVLIQRLLDGARPDVRLVAQDDDTWDRLPPAIRAAVAELLHDALSDPDLRDANVTTLPDGDLLWLSLTCTGGAPPADLPIDLSRPSARGADGEQWWLEWTLLPPNSEETDAIRGRARRGGADRRPLDVPRWRRALAGE